MANKAVFEIVVTNKGLKITQKGVDDLGASVERTKKKTQEANKAVNPTFRLFSSNRKILKTKSFIFI